jgi:hypothetical protein
MLQAGRSQVRVAMTSLNYFSMYLILPVELGPGVYSDSNRNKHQKKEKLLGSKTRTVRKADNLTVVSRLLRNCGVLNLSQPYRFAQPVTGIALLFTFTLLISYLIYTG